MAAKIGWNKYEAAILLDYYLKVLSKEIPRKEAVKTVSQKLRRMAIASGIEIDEIFRNEKGINFQMMSMESAYRGYTVFKPAPRLFIEIVYLYRNNRDEYDRILETAKAMDREAEKKMEERENFLDTKAATRENETGNRNRDKFTAWLFYNTDGKKIYSILTACKAINDFCLKTNVLKKPLFETTDLHTVRQVQRIVEQNKVFRFQNAGIVKESIAAIGLYAKYIAENREKLKADEDGDNLMRGSPVQYVKKESIAQAFPSEESGNSEFPDNSDSNTPGTNDNILGQRGVKRLDFYNIPDLKYSKPVRCVLLGEELEDISSWRNLYIQVFTKLYEKYKDKIPVNRPFGDVSKRMDFCTGEYSFSMTDPKMIAPGRYLETNHSAEAIVKRIKELLRICGVGFDEILIEYLGKDDAVKSPALKTFGVEKRDVGYPNKPNAAFTTKVDKEVGINGIKRLDFYNIPDLKYSKPVKCVFLGEELEDVTNWKSVYLKVFTKLYEKYEALIPLNRSFGETVKRLDFCTGEYAYSMTAPRMIAPGRYIETNYSAKDIAKKIKTLLRLCGIDYDELEIYYAGQNSEIAQTSINLPNSSYSADVEIDNDNGKSDSEDERFRKYLGSKYGLNDSESRICIWNIKQAERYAVSNGFVNRKLFGADLKTARRTARELFRDERFVDSNDMQHDVYRTAIKSLIAFLEQDEPDTLQKEENAKEYVIFPEREFIEETLSEKFPKGYRPDSFIHRKKFREALEEKYGKTLEIPDEILQKEIKKCGIFYDEMVYSADKVLSTESKEKVLNFIEETFESGKKAIYYKAIYETFRDDFLGSGITGPEMLRKYLDYVTEDKYYSSGTYMSKDPMSAPDPYEEVKEYLIGKARPVKYRELYSALPHIPERKIKQILSGHSEFIRNSPSEYIHVCSINLTPEQVESAETEISDSIEKYGFANGLETVSILKEKYPEISESNPRVSDPALRDAIKNRLQGKFSFNGNVITPLGKSKTSSDIFREFCRERDRFTVSDLKELAGKLGTPVNLEKAYENSLRISRRTFVSDKYAEFDTEKTDGAIDLYCPGDYIPIGKIDQFGLFPEAGFPWNKFLLESYVARFSKNFILLNNRFYENGCFGAIVRAGSGFENYTDLLSDAVAESGIPLSEGRALEYLCGEGYLATKYYSKAGEILAKAKEIRNRRGL